MLVGVRESISIAGRCIYVVGSRKPAFGIAKKTYGYD